VAALTAHEQEMSDLDDKIHETELALQRLALQRALVKIEVDEERRRQFHACF
jgi:hypothetical protein